MRSCKHLGAFSRLRSGFTNLYRNTPPVEVASFKEMMTGLPTAATTMTMTRTMMGRPRRRRLLLLVPATALLGISAFVATSRGLAVAFKEATYAAASSPSSETMHSSAAFPPLPASVESSSLLLPAEVGLESVPGQNPSAAETTTRPAWESASIESSRHKNGSHAAAQGLQELLAETLRATSVSMPSAAAKSSNNVYYSLARTDRAGVSILDMVSALAYGYAKNLTYRGACYRKAMTLDAPRRQADKLALIRAIGLQDLLVFACPPPSRRHLIVPRARYYDNRYSLMTPKFINWLRSESTAVSPKAAAAPGGSAVVHMRRGDVDPCKQWKDRYLPSKYYLDVLDRYVPAGVPVTVYSETASFEPFGDFGNVTVKLDTDVAEVWEAIMAASHVVLSRSSFAYVPALLNANNATVIYPPRWPVVVPPRGWKQVDTDIQERSERRVKQLVKERCHNYTSVQSGRSSFNASRRRRR